MAPGSITKTTMLLLLFSESLGFHPANRDTATIETNTATTVNTNSTTIASCMIPMVARLSSITLTV
jgi:hypothetical protein